MTSLEVTVLEPGRYQVSGGVEPHVVVVHPHGAVCDCPGFRYRRTCRHIAAASRHQETQDRGAIAEKGSAR